MGRRGAPLRERGLRRDVAGERLPGAGGAGHGWGRGSAGAGGPAGLWGPFKKEAPPYGCPPPPGAARIGTSCLSGPFELGVRGHPSRQDAGCWSGPGSGHDSALPSEPQTRKLRRGRRSSGRAAGAPRAGPLLPSGSHAPPGTPPPQCPRSCLEWGRCRYFLRWIAVEVRWCQQRENFVNSQRRGDTSYLSSQTRAPAPARSASAPGPGCLTYRRLSANLYGVND